MKKILLLFALIIILSSCTKEAVQPDESKAVTQWISNYDQNWRLVETHIMIHWCSVSGQELKTYQAMEGRKDTSACPNNAVTWIEISKSDCSTNK